MDKTKTYKNIMIITLYGIFMLSLAFATLKILSLNRLINSSYESGEYIFSMPIIKVIVYLSIPLLALLFANEIIKRIGCVKNTDIVISLLLILLIILAVSFIYPKILFFPVGLKNDIFYWISELIGVKGSKIKYTLTEIMATVIVILMVLYPFFILKKKNY